MSFFSATLMRINEVRFWYRCGKQSKAFMRLRGFGSRLGSTGARQEDIGLFMAHYHRKHDVGALTHVNAPKHGRHRRLMPHLDIKALVSRPIRAATTA